MTSGSAPDGIQVLPAPEVLQAVRKLKEGAARDEELHRRKAAEGMVNLQSQGTKSESCNWCPAMCLVCDIHADFSCYVALFTGTGAGSSKANKAAPFKKPKTVSKKKISVLGASENDVNQQRVEECCAEAGMEPIGHRWMEDECILLWSFIEDFQDELYHGKDSLTRPQVVGKITTMLSAYCMSIINGPPFLQNHKQMCHLLVNARSLYLQV